MLKNPRKHVIACVSGMGQIVRMLVEMNAGVFTSSSWAGLASQTHQLEIAKAYTKISLLENLTLQ